MLTFRQFVESHLSDEASLKEVLPVRIQAERLREVSDTWPCFIFPNGSIRTIREKEDFGEDPTHWEVVSSVFSVDWDAQPPGTKRYDEDTIQMDRLYAAGIIRISQSYYLSRPILRMSCGANKMTQDQAETILDAAFLNKYESVEIDVWDFTTRTEHRHVVFNLADDPRPEDLISRTR